MSFKHNQKLTAYYFHIIVIISQPSNIFTDHQSVDNNLHLEAATCDKVDDTWCLINGETLSEHDISVESDDTTVHEVIYRICKTNKAIMLLKCI